MSLSIEVRADCAILSAFNGTALGPVIRMLLLSAAVTSGPACPSLLRGRCRSGSLWSVYEGSCARRSKSGC